MSPCSFVPSSANPYTATELKKIIEFILFLSANLTMFLVPSTLTS